MELDKEVILARMGELARDCSNCIVSIKFLSFSLNLVIVFSFFMFLFWYSLKRDSLEVKDSIKEIRKETAEMKREVEEIRKYHLKKNLNRV